MQCIHVYVYMFEGAGVGERRDRDLQNHHCEDNPFAYIKVLCDKVLQLIKIPSWIIREVLISR